MYPNSLKYTEGHVWLKITKSSVTLGVTEPFLDMIGDPIHIELPEKGESIDAEMGFAEIESAGDSLEAVSPLEGKVTAINTDLLEDLSLLTRDAYDEGWLIRIKPSDAVDTADLMTAAEYEDFVASEEEDMGDESPFLDMDEDD